MLRESIFFVFAEDQVTVDDDVEYPVRALDELGLDAVLAFDCLRQTGGLGQVVSHNAVFDADLHADEFKRIDVGIALSLGRNCHAPTATLPGAPMCSTMASAKAEHFSSVAPSMSRSKS